MTSGIFKAILVESITVVREQRQRRELTDIAELARSIESAGLINPITVTRDNILIAGERRLTAVKSLGWSHINAQYVEDLSELEIALIEFEENVKRVELAWQDRVDAIDKYHKLQCQINGTWTMEQTADAIGVTSQETCRLLHVAAEIKLNPEILNAPKLSVAKGITERARDRRGNSQLKEALKASGPSTFDKSVETPADTILNESFLHWAPTYEGLRFNLIHCDFPYGIGIDKADQGAGAALGGYADTVAIYRALMQCLSDNFDRIVAPSAHIIFWFSPKHLEYTKQALIDMGWEINPAPLVWLRSDNSGILPDPSRGPRQVTEFAWFGSFGDRKIVRAKSNGYAAPQVARDIHMSEKPEPMLRHFLEMLVDENTVMLDPTAGSGSALRAADSLGANTIVGLEIDETYCQLANDKFNKAKRLRSVA